MAGTRKSKRKKGRSLDPILGHERVLRQLWGALQRDGLHHAYLFEGPRGVGKHTVAMRLAMAANCTGAPPPEAPCGTCPTCIQIEAGNHPDVLTLEPPPESLSGTISVDLVREVVRKAGYHRYGSRRRFIVIDPAEAMLDSAANALLKTLEEPPEGTGFVLIATNSSALLPTIVSRCQRVRFGAVPEDALTSWLEERGIDDAAMTARISQGCPGRALQLAGGALKKRTELRQRLLAVVSEGSTLSDVYGFSGKITTGKNRQDWSKKVKELLSVTEDLLRDATVQGSGAELPLVNADVPDIVADWSRRLWPDGIAACARAVDDARLDLESNVSGKTVVDAFVTRVRQELGHSPR